MTLPLSRLLLFGLVAAALLATSRSAEANVFGQDNRREVTSQDYPFCCVGLLQIGGGTGTGFLVGRNLVMTNAHCTIGDDGVPYKNIVFHAGVVSGKPTRSSRVNRIWRGTDKAQQHRDRDWAILRIDENLGDELGWLSLSDKLPGSAELIGYSGDLLDTLHSGTRSKGELLKLPLTKLLMHDADATRGSSGGPMLAIVAGRPQVVALNCAERRDSDKSVTVEKFDIGHANIAIPVSGFLKDASEIIGDAQHDEFCDVMVAMKDAARNGDLRKTLASLDAALGLQPENVTVRMIRAMLRAGRGELAEALTDVTLAAEQAPGFTDVTLLRGKLQFALGQYEECVETLRPLLRRNPQHEDALALFSQAELKLFVAAAKSWVEGK